MCGACGRAERLMKMAGAGRSVVGVEAQVDDGGGRLHPI
jgi:hypothetical protein